MNEVLTLAVIPAALWLLLVFLRVPGVTLVLSILVGKLFAEELSQSLYDAVSSIISISDVRHVQLFLLLLPVVLNIILTQSKVAKSKSFSNAIPLFFASITLILFALPYTDLLGKINETGQEIIASYQHYIVSATGGLALLFSWSPNLKRGKHKSK